MTLDDPAKVAVPRAAQDVIASRGRRLVRAFAEQAFDRGHGGDGSLPVWRSQTLQHCSDLPLGAAFNGHERAQPARGQRKLTLASVAGRSVAGNQPALLEIAQHAAEVSGVHVQRPRNLARGRHVGMGNLVQHPELAERIGAPEIRFAQQSDMPGVKAVEMTHRGDVRLDALRSGHGFAASAFS